jgi:hypothetical protein
VGHLGVFVVVEQFLKGRDVGAMLEVHGCSIRSVLIGDRILVHRIAISYIAKELLDHVELVKSHLDVRPRVLLLSDDSDRFLGE